MIDDFEIKFIAYYSQSIPAIETNFPAETNFSDREPFPPSHSEMFHDVGCADERFIAAGKYDLGERSICEWGALFDTPAIDNQMKDAVKEMLVRKFKDSNLEKTFLKALESRGEIFGN